MTHAFFLTNEEKGIILTIYNILYKGIEGMDQNLYQKIGVTIGQLAQDFLTRNVGDRIPSVSEYQEKFNVSRGTIQNALAYRHTGIWGPILRESTMSSSKIAVSGKRSLASCLFRIL